MLTEQVLQRNKELFFLGKLDTGICKIFIPFLLQLDVIKFLNFLGVCNQGSGIGLCTISWGGFKGCWILLWGREVLGRQFSDNWRFGKHEEPVECRYF